MEAAGDAPGARETESPGLVESIVAIDVRDKRAMGCSIFSAADGVLKIANDIPMANENVAEEFLNYAQATTILMSRRVPEAILTFVEKHVERSTQNLHLRLMPSSDFSHTFACEELSSLGINGDCSFPSASPLNAEEQCIGSNGQAVQRSGPDEPHCMKLVRCGSLIDLESVASLSCASALLTELHRRRSLSSSHSNPGIFGVRSVTIFNLADHVFISEESLLSLQIINHESHPNSQAWSIDSNSSSEKENLSIYGLLHPLASTPQGRAHLRHMFLQPTSNLGVITDRQRTISLLLHPNNEEKSRRVGSGTLKRFASQSLKFREIAMAFSHANQSSIVNKVIDVIDPLVLTRVGDLIERVVNFDQAKSQQRYSVRSGIDDGLDGLKRQYDGLNSFLTEVANHVAQDLPVWARQYIRSCIFLPQLGFLTVVEQEHQQSGSSFDEDCAGDGRWKKLFTDNETAYYKNHPMTELDEQYGDIYSQISDREVEVMQRLAMDVIVHEKSLLAAAAVCGEFDALLALAVGAAKFGWKAPQVTTANILHIKGGRHPLQELLSPSFVSNDCYIGDDDIVAPGRTVQALVLTGPNQSGKSVYIKQVAIIVYLAHVGSFVPADDAVIGTVDKILTRISLRESVSGTGSTFGHDLKDVSHAMKYSTARSLVLIDEFGNGTTANDGAGMFAAMLDYFLSSVAETPRILAATHFHEIFANGYLSHYATLKLAHMEVRTDWDAIDPEDQVTYLFRLIEGYSSTSLGSQCAVLSGIPEGIITRVKEIEELLS
ncbi:P-loop containing nucleoside triphosphate hydrolase protein [Trichoderma longibrachiatum]